MLCVLWNQPVRKRARRSSGYAPQRISEAFTCAGVKARIALGGYRVSAGAEAEIKILSSRMQFAECAVSTGSSFTAVRCEQTSGLGMFSVRAIENIEEEILIAILKND